MSEQNIIRGSKNMKSRTDWARVDAMTDDEIDYSDCPPLGKEFWENAKLVIPEPKVPIGARFDKDVISWFKKQGPGYQSRMNAVLKTYIEAQKALALKHKAKKKAS